MYDQNKRFPGWPNWHTRWKTSLIFCRTIFCSIEHRDSIHVCTFRYGWSTNIMHWVHNSYEHMIVHLLHWLKIDSLLVDIASDIAMSAMEQTYLSRCSYCEVAFYIPICLLWSQHAYSKKNKPLVQSASVFDVLLAWRLIRNTCVPMCPSHIISPTVLQNVWLAVVILSYASQRLLNRLLVVWNLVSCTGWDRKSVV